MGIYCSKSKGNGPRGRGQVSSTGVARKRVSLSTIVLASFALTATACASGGTPAARPAGGAAGTAGTVAKPAGGLNTASTETGPATVTTAAQAGQVFNNYVTQTAAALAAGDTAAASALDRRVPWHELSAQVATEKSRHEPVAPDQYGTPSFYIPEQHGFPQWFVASVRRTAPPGSPTSLAGAPQAPSGQVLMLFQKMAAAQPWKLNGSVQLEPGQQMPTFATGAGGAIKTARLDDSGSYLAGPDVVGPLQASVVDDGPAAPAASAVAGGPFTTGLYQRQSAVKAPAGDVRQWSLQGSNDPRFALRTADGGALVFYSMDLDTITEVPAVLAQANSVKAGKPIAIPPEFIPLLPPRHVPPRVRVKTQYMLTFAAIDPPASARNAKIQIIAADGTPSWASAS